MEKIVDKYRVFTRRAFLVGAGQAAIMAGLGLRLGYLQLVEGEQYQTLADRNSIDLRLISPSRGIIYDRAGERLADNTQNFKLLITPEKVKDMDVFLEKISELVKITDAQKADFKERVESLPRFAAIELRDSLEWEDVSKIELNSVYLPGVSIEMGEQRRYPLAESTAHIIGYVSAVNKTDAKNDPELLRLPSLKIGKTGIEKTYDTFMRGKAGTRKMEVNVAGREIRELEKRKPVTGDSVVLSIDKEIQNYVMQQLSEHKSASAIVMDSQTGAIYAACSHPSFDPNLFVNGLSPQKWQELLSNETYPLTNKALSGQYAPGSTFKMITAMAALEAGITSRSKTVFCPGYYELGTGRFHCWKRGGHGKVDIIDALAESCDTYFYELSREVGINRIANMARRFGLGSTLDFELSEERSGLIPDENWKLGHLGVRWQLGDTIVAAIGQGYILTTPLQLAVMTARLVNGGYAVKPWLAYYVGKHRRPPKTWPKMDVNQAHLNIVIEGMNAVVNAPNGTARGSRIQAEGYSMGGKTGTAQVQRITKAQRNENVQQESLPWRSRHHALFVGYGPIENPRYVCSIVVEHGIGGSATAAPLAKRILEFTEKRDPASKDIQKVKA
mgnify:CR=1 FL=1